MSETTAFLNVIASPTPLLTPDMQTAILEMSKAAEACTTAIVQVPQAPAPQA